MKIRLAVLISLLLIIMSLFTAGCGNGGSREVTSGNLEKVSEFEGGHLYRAGKIYVAQLNGNYREMGRQYGGLMKSQIEQFYEEAIDGYFAMNNALPRGTIEEEFAKSFQIYPARFQQVLEGMEETSGLSLQQLIMIDNAVYLPLLVSMSGMCSFAAAWGDYTGGGPLVCARSFDYFPEFQEYNDTLTVAVFNPDDGSRSVATIVNAGQIGTMSVFNDANLAMGVHDGTPSGGQDQLAGAVPTMISNVSVFLDSSDIEMVRAYMLSTLPRIAVIANVADPQAAHTFEKTTSATKERGGQEDGLLVATNHFIEPTWDLQTPGDISTHESADVQDSIMRYNGLLSLGMQYKGEIDAEVMKEIFDVPISEGGPTRPTTMYQFVAVPSELQLWVKACNYQDWVLVELGELFN
jgi:hypothetical protein